MSRAARLLALLLAAFVLVPAGGATASTTDTAIDLENEVMCLSCGRPLSSSGGTGAEDQRALIRRMLDRGMSKQEVKDALVREYGDRVLVQSASPLAAIAPWLAAIIGLASIAALLLRRGRSDGPADPATGDSPTPDPDELSADDQARIDAELADVDRG